ncbi:hypothetical protein EA658_16590 [Pseudoxanthomonas winnipegensis]|uniref:Uncharacterized protein n=1 Tax=Pseudoxanthomonas winnipegensis TaxID=2480810 RepID=A0ABY1WCI5_9GAMM|nr:hypothetical protein [Pseudoxanthomonas winnipegensis]TAA11281.1 hypothetical protein EA659_08005 [Pseudoxanthomonas winnipegensis]TAA18704.1 hypothetical protein EA658_16590 [Pseudoxanthomonas winnipegensis]TAH73920.1 hypothetical protein EA657_00155 [Pseudoxanthomonas winnipegensis]
MSIRFAGKEFESFDAMAREFPRYGFHGAREAIRRGATTPHEVEVFVYDRSKPRPKPTPKAVASQTIKHRKKAA